MLFFAGILVGHHGGVVCVEVNEQARVGILRRAFIDEVNRDAVEKRIQCPADSVELYLAKVHGSWLQTQDGRANMLSAGKVPKEIEDILSGDPLDPTTFARDICEVSVPEKTVQLLIVPRADSTENGKTGTISGIKREPGIERADLGTTKKAANMETRNSQSTSLKSNEKKDKGDYKVGDLASFASAMTRLLVKESEQNNDKLITLMRQLHNETAINRSDVERTGLAAVIAHLRKSSSRTVEQTASSLRKHMIKILINDMEKTPH